MRIGGHEDDVPVLLVRHGARDLLMRRRTVYDDMISALRNKLRLDDDVAVSLRVMLDEKDAEIDEDAWSVVVPYLDQVNVGVAPIEVGDGTTGKGKEKEHKRTPSIHSAEDLFGNNGGAGGSGSQNSEWDHVDDVPATTSKIEKPVEIKQEPDIEDEDEGSPPPRRHAPVKPAARDLEPEEPPSPVAPKVPKFKPAPPAASPVKHVMSSPVKSPSQATEQLTDPNERFKITVRGPEPEQRAALLTRGRYPVRKVLNAVCKVFGVDPDSARLSLLVLVGDDEYEKFPCDVDETMAHAGVEPDAELVLELEAGNGEEEDDDDDDE